MILSAGKGTRLGEITKDIPKPMLPVGGVPLIERTIEHLANCGFRKIIINLHYLGHQISDHLGDGRRLGVVIEYSQEDQLLGTAGSVSKAKELLLSGGEDNFLVLYGDVVSNHNFQDLYQRHLWFVSNQLAVATILLHRRVGSNSVVDVSDEHRVISFHERPMEKNFQEHWVNSGLYCFHKKIFDFIPSGGKELMDFPKDIFQSIIKERKLFAIEHLGYRCAIDSMERYQQVQRFDFAKK